MPLSNALQTPPTARTSGSAAGWPRSDNISWPDLSTRCTWQFRPSFSVPGNIFSPASTYCSSAINAPSTFPHPTPHTSSSRSANKRGDLAVRHIVLLTLDEFQRAVLLEDDGSGFCMFLIDLAIGGGNGRNKSIDIGHDLSPSGWMIGLPELCDVDIVHRSPPALPLTRKSRHRAQACAFLACC